MLGKGTTFPELSSFELGHFFVPTPTSSEQQRIADYLDDKCGQLDSCMELTRRSMEKLREYKNSLIAEAVTRGLDPDVPMKDSGIPWIGKIPEDWNITDLNNYIELLPGFAFPSSSFAADKGIKLFRGINLGTNIIRWTDSIYYDSDISEKLKIFLLKENDIVLGMDRPWISEGLRIAMISAKDIPSLLVQRVCRIRSKSYMHQKFLFYIFISDIFKNSIGGATTGVSVPHISARQITMCKIPLPPLPEQQRIADYLDKKCAHIDALLEQKQKLLDKLADYKKSLIFECVTGKREVTA